MIFRSEGPLRKLLHDRIQKGPLLKRLREEFFKASTKIVDVASFDGMISKDIANAKALVVIFSPYLNIERVKLFLSIRSVKDALNRNIRIVVVTRPAKGGKGGVSKPKEHEDAINILKKAGIKIVEINALHFKAVIIDNEILYLGSINPLSILPREYYPPDYMVRFVSEALVDEIIENVLTRKEYEKILKE